MQRERAYKILNDLKKIRASLPDEKALEYISFYPRWQEGKRLKTGDRVEYNKKLYKVITEHTTQADWTPDITRTLFEPIDVVNKGTIENPIIAAIGMTYFKDKYYLDELDNKIYLCTRDDSNGNGTVLQFMPSALVGTYFTIVD